MIRAKSDAERYKLFLENTNKVGECLEYITNSKTNLYPQTITSNKGIIHPFRIHRFIAAHHAGLTLDDIIDRVVMHECDNPKCINPQHLTIGSHKENTLDMIVKGRQPKNWIVKTHKRYPTRQERRISGAYSLIERILS